MVIYQQLQLLTESTPTALTVPLYWSESKFYRCCLSVSFRYGRKLSTLGILSPDAYADGRALYSADAVAIARHRSSVATYLQAQRVAKHNL
jgi:hypothetical protein